MLSRLPETIKVKLAIKKLQGDDLGNIIHIQKYKNLWLIITDGKTTKNFISNKINLDYRYPKGLKKVTIKQQVSYLKEIIDNDRIMWDD